MHQVNSNYYYYYFSKINIFNLAITADGFNLYLVDETGKNLRLFTTENDEYIKSIK